MPSMEILSVFYLLGFVFSGFLVSRCVFALDSPSRRLFFGLVFGLVMLLWFPVLFAFLMDFTLGAQLLGLAAALFVGAGCELLRRRKKAEPQRKESFALKPFLLTVLPLVCIGWVLICNHTITSASDGSLHVGQSTYGDLCMHLGFITSISVQKSFPPQYSILPGAQLCYPFLCDSVSSTFYTLGASLRFATILPALYAYLVVVLGVYFFFEEWFSRPSVTVLATYLFFVGGGFGFAYIFNNRELLDAQGIDRFRELLTGFYKTPTNLPDEGLRWVNPIADMLVPQRATLFGWALLFPALQLLHRGTIRRERRCFFPLGVLAGAMPLVHTHSFLALGILSLVLFVRELRDPLLSHAEKPTERAFLPSFGAAVLLAAVYAAFFLLIESGSDPDFGRVVTSLLGVFLGLLLLLRAFQGQSTDHPVSLPAALLLSAPFFLSSVLFFILSRSGDVWFFTLLLPLLVLLVTAPPTVRLFLWALRSSGENRNGLLCFFAFGVIAVLLAAPQLVCFTFRQSTGEQFLRWQFNWDNVSDGWLWFYIKNMGLCFLLLVPAFFSAEKPHRRFYSASLILWLICELVLFQPNPYDNNKLLFVWYAMTCGLTADYLIGLRRRVSSPSPVARIFLSAVLLVTLFLSGSLTLLREYVSADHIGFYTENEKQRFGLSESGYQVISPELVKMAGWICENTAPDALFLTDSNHNNAVAMLTGRNIFCGSGSFLYYHGIAEYPRREAMLARLFSDPEGSFSRAAEEYGIDYVLISGTERSNRSPDEAWFREHCETVYSEPGITIYRVDP